ncbi:hypothetical protein SCLCIDRAFT_1212537 [Scleroderma citrinum Foug A]|uniref:Metaxin glutathione S-transferase domain-containing protein n=1 Tax=Scleroderma citrinum Foug A TaxID=1036808 RepID=A0A0C3DXS3_9AGAM|nr:hypothetical protein SCLCIDRAFT_1212537 [Scleroderma citrinum Foug A]
MASTLTLPAPIKKAFSFFPLHTHPPVPLSVRYPLVKPTLWIAPPRTLLDGNASVDILSSDVECLKWQAYIALRGLTDIAVRWDIPPEGALEGRLPNLHVPADVDSENQLLVAQNIPGWVDSRVASGVDTLEGYQNQQAKDESHAWVSLLEGIVHATLVLSQPTRSFLNAFIQSHGNKGQSIEAILNPPPAPLTGFSSLFPPFGANVTLPTLQGQYTAAVAALSERLGEDKWFLGSMNPTALDALIFAYLHTILHSKDPTRVEVARRANLVAWERHVRAQVQATFYTVAN